MSNPTKQPGGKPVAPFPRPTPGPGSRDGVPSYVPSSPPLERPAAPNPQPYRETPAPMPGLPVLPIPTLPAR